jgi:GNAT superfamily N-acetyltransferase
MALAPIIEDLENVPQFALLVAGWVAREWYELPIHNFWASLTLGGWKRTETLPFTLVALSESSLVGTASVVAQDMDIRPELSPWLACVYVDEKHRNRGYASQLISAISSESVARGLDRLYLFTDAHPGLYSRMGWFELEREVPFEGTVVTIMMKPLLGYAQ